MCWHIFVACTLLGLACCFRFQLTEVRISTRVMHKLSALNEVATPVLLY